MANRERRLAAEKDSPRQQSSHGNNHRGVDRAAIGAHLRSSGSSAITSHRKMSEPVLNGRPEVRT